MTRDAMERLLELAARQHSVVTQDEITRCGIRRRERDTLVEKGLLRRVYKGVYACPGGRLTRWGEAIALSRACGPGAALSHSTAAAIHSFPGIPGAVGPEISVCGTAHPRAPGAVVHRVARLDPKDVEHRRGVLVTASPRTLVDLAGRFEPGDLARVVDEGLVRRLWTVGDLSAAVARSGGRGRRGVRSLGLILRSRDPEAPDSRLEHRVIRALAPLRPFQVHCEVVIEGELIILDVAWPRRKVAAEIDGFGVHGVSRSKFDRDRRHANLLLAHGWRVVRVTSAMSNGEILAVLGSLLGGVVA